MDKRTIKAAVMVLGAIAGLSMIGCRSASAQTVNDWGLVNFPAAACDSPGINDAGTTVGDCDLYQGKGRAGFVQLLAASSPTQLAPLASTANGAPCEVTALSDIPPDSHAQAGSEIITGWCADANAVSQGVFWISGTPTKAPTQLKPLSLLGLLPDVQTKVKGVSPAGVMIGVSINSSGKKTPVTWSSNGAPTQLGAGPVLERQLRAAGHQRGKHTLDPRQLQGRCNRRGDEIGCVAGQGLPLFGLAAAPERQELLREGYQFLGAGSRSVRLWK